MKIQKNPPPEACTSPTSIIDSNHPSIITLVKKIIGGKATSPVERAVKLYNTVRDKIWYDPYSPFFLPEHYRASNVLKRGRSFCVPKASLLCALSRAAGIPARIGFVTVKNHLATRQLIEYIGTDLFVYHGFVEFYLKNRWIKATPAFNKELCQRHDVPPLEFNGQDDSIFQPFNHKNQKFMEYVEDHGTYEDIPVEKIVLAWKKTYGENRVAKWIKIFNENGNNLKRDFYSEEIISN